MLINTDSIVGAVSQNSAHNKLTLECAVQHRTTCTTRNPAQQANRVCALLSLALVQEQRILVGQCGDPEADLVPLDP